MKIKINTIDFKGSLVNGPGLRSLLFMQGCSRHCEECHNKSTWDFKKGRSMEVDELALEIKKRCLNKKITITGGEPLDQYNALLELVKELSEFDICVYTSYDYDEIPTELFDYIEYIKVGRYMKEFRTTTIPYVGSSNQKFIDLVN